jgi:hypothetical protein
MPIVEPGLRHDAVATGQPVSNASCKRAAAIGLFKRMSANVNVGAAVTSRSRQIGLTAEHHAIGWQLGWQAAPWLGGRLSVQ